MFLQKIWFICRAVAVRYAVVAFIAVISGWFGAQLRMRQTSNTIGGMLTQSKWHRTTINESVTVGNESDLARQFLQNNVVAGATSAVNNLAVFSRKGTEVQGVAIPPLLTEVDRALRALAGSASLKDVYSRPDARWLDGLVSKDLDEAQGSLRELIATSDALVRRRGEALEKLRALPESEYRKVLKDAEYTRLPNVSTTAPAGTPLRPKDTNLAVQISLLNQALGMSANLFQGLARHYCLQGQCSVGMACTIEAIMIGGPSPSWRPAMKPLLSVPLAEPPTDQQNELPDSATRLGWLGPGVGGWNPNVAFSVEGRPPQRRADLWYRVNERWRLLGSVTSDDVVQTRFVDKPPKYAQLIWSGDDGWTVLRFCSDHPDKDPGVYWRRGENQLLIEIKGEAATDP